MTANMAQFVFSGAPARPFSGVAAFLLFYVYAGYPLLLALIGLFVRGKRPEPGYYPKLSVLIAAYNEEAAIAAKDQADIGAGISERQAGSAGAVGLLHGPD